jgi:antitoxin StbD
MMFLRATSITDSVPRIAAPTPGDIPQNSHSAHRLRARRPPVGDGMVRRALKGTFKNTFKSTNISTHLTTRIPMTHLILADMSASVSELKKDPMGTVAAGEGLPVAILNRNAPAFYCIPAKAYEAMLERLEDLELNAIANAREGQAIIGVTLDEL